jgi:aminopeptidase N
VDLNIEVPLNRTAVANGALVAVDSTATTHTWHWSHAYPISPYLIALSVAPYRILSDTVVTDPRITVYHHPGYRKKSEVSFRFVDLMMEAFEARYGPYPFEKFAYMTTWKGDMEHQTCVSHALMLVDSTNTYDDILSHEMGHMWFGDCVTYGDWRDIWLSEGFATYSEAVYREYKNGLADYHAYMTNIIDVVINSGVTDGLYAPSEYWGVVNYEKGACLLHMLRGILDDDAAFWQALRDYLANHQYGVAVTADFIADVNASVGQDLTWFFDPWIYGSGHPVYEYGWSYADLGGGTYRVDVVIRQVQSTGTLFDMPVDFRVQTAGGDYDFSRRIDQAEQVVSFLVPAPPTGLLVDPDDWILDEQQLAPTSADYTEEVAAAQALSLLTPRPNPFRTRTQIRYYLPEAGEVRVRIHDVAGRVVRTLADGWEMPGSRALWWDRRGEDGRRVAPGVYWVSLEARRGRLSEKVVVLD